MVFNILIIIFSLVFLLALHEFGHFILAKKFGVKVEEFGIGIPPRILKKKIGETIYSLNLLPIGAFVKLYGEEERIKEPTSFSGKPIWQRTLIVIGGVVTFWIISAILLTIIAGIWGLPIAVEDESNHNLIDSKIQIIKIASGSPAEVAGLRSGDTILKLVRNDQELKTDKVKEVIEFTQAHKGEEITLAIQRGKEIFEVSLVPRVSPPEGEGPMGVALIRTALKLYPWSKAPIQGILLTAKTTISIPYLFGDILKKAIRGERVEEVEFKGLVGISRLMVGELQKGINYFLSSLAMISIFLAFFNILPIPALDGGRLLFLGIEKIRGRPLNQKIEQRINTIFFALLIALMIWVTIKDIQAILKNAPISTFL
ncbi:site-2 protease family protein [Patescibacteria group bacterium]|nr:site-2 protease family protein [Patescibacteria group bacterium]